MTKNEFENLDEESKTEAITNNGRLIISYYKGPYTFRLYKIDNFLVKMTVSHEKGPTFESIKQIDGFTIFESFS